LFGGNGHAAKSLPGPIERRPADEIKALARPQIERLLTRRDVPLQIRASAARAEGRAGPGRPTVDQRDCRWRRQPGPRLQAAGDDRFAAQSSP
jgi:hypothetical protein